MMGVNRAILVGTLGRDPEMRSLKSGVAVAQFTVATNRRIKSEDGNGHTEETEWHRVVAFGALAEVCGRYLQKGRSVYLEGRLRTREWTDKDGHHRRTTEVVADDVQFLPGGAGRRPPGDTAGRGDEGGAWGAGRHGGSADAGAQSDDLPF